MGVAEKLGRLSGYMKHPGDTVRHAYSDSGAEDRVDNASRKASEAIEFAKHPITTMKNSYKEGYLETHYKERREELEEPEYESTKSADVMWDKAIGNKRHDDYKTEPVRTERVKEQKPVVKNYYYGNGAKTTKKQSSGSHHTSQKVSRNLSQPNFNNVNDKLINASNRQTDSINDYNRRIRDMFG